MEGYLRHIDRDLTYAAIDIGSNAVRLLVGEVIERDDHPVIKKQTLVRVPIRLGEDVFDSGAISRAKCDYLIKSLKAFRLLTEVYNVPYLRCCATSAMREATNRDEVLARVEMESGIHIEVISGRVEADLIVNTFWTQDLLKDRSYLYIDVGGGSTELTWLEQGRRVKSASFKVGTVRTLKGKVQSASWAEMRAFLDELRVQHGSLMGIGTGGNINRIFKENGNTFGEPLSRQDIKDQRDRIANHSFEDRVKLLRLRPDRADVIIPAADIFLQVMDYAGIEEVFVPKVGLADGVIYDLYMRQRGKVRYPAGAPIVT
ncbi:MAG: exopolyphosphatase [Flavobacteriales bacterium]|jgi:exopolyphosphatase/guanosine-5'-triphosphate,3'-diphosphate pyrophosphatase|nr:exopolyphosphatase [Flavobacteriales bacterium]